MAAPAGQFGVGALLGFVWLPCVGPTLGAAITLASLGQSLSMAFAIMFTFGVTRVQTVSQLTEECVSEVTRRV
jgi:cytochrome c biogenesis protein CcdA